jgi:hypothetical protein
VADRIGKFKVSKDQYAIYASKLNKSGDTVDGDFSVAGDLDILNTISASSGDFLIPGDLNFATVDGDDRTTILRTTGIGSTLGIYNNLVYIDGINLGIGTITPSGKLEVVGSVVLSNLPTAEPSITGSLWVSGSTTTGQSGLLAVFNP